MILRVRVVQEYISCFIWQAVYMIACYIRIIYFLTGIDISENLYDKDGERFFDEIVNLKKRKLLIELTNDGKKLECIN